MALKMRGIFACCVLLLALAQADHHLHHHGSDHSDVNCHKLSAPNNDFAFELYKTLNAKTPRGKNIFYSPLGISTALAMVSVGARGVTHSQLFSTLGYSAFNQTQVNEAYEHLFRMHGHSQVNQLDVGNAVVIRSGFNPALDFLDDVKQFYSGEAFNVDFSKTEEAIAEINTYIANKTHDMIQDMVKELSPEMVMMLINYVYFKGQWVKPFDSDLTHKADFHVDRTTKVQVDMMMRTGNYMVYWDRANHTTVLMLPYEGKSSMMIVLPDEGKMEKVERFINKDYIRHWQKSVSQGYVEVFLPKFSISADASLDTTLREMGIINAFEDNADFTGITDGVTIKISKASHKAALSVTELGTEAAASGISEMIALSLPPSVRINRPFLVFILESSTESILFMGKINNPTAM